MPTKPVPKIEAWSFSRYNAYNQCPFKLKCTAIDKLKSPPVPAMERGKHIHKLAEEFVQGKFDDELPPELDNFEEEFVSLKRHYKKGLVEVEQQWAFNQYWQPTDWFAKDTWSRIMVDATEEMDDKTIKIIDYKTGRVQTEYTEQLELYALGAFCMYEGLERVFVELWFLDHGEIVEGEAVMVDQVVELQKSWVGRTKKMLNDTRFEPRQNQYCYNCHFRSDNGGPCKY